MAGFKQEMPPPGGYADINVGAQYAVKYIKGWKWIAGAVLLNAGLVFVVRQNRNRKQLLDIEYRDARIALEPLLEAEADRLLLKQCIVNREAEQRAMGGVRGWKLGTWYGRPLFHNLGRRFIAPAHAEYYMHTPLRIRSDDATEYCDH